MAILQRNITTVFSIVFASSLALLVSTIISPRAPYRIDMMNLLIVFAFLRFRGWERVYWFIFLYLTATTLYPLAFVDYLTILFLLTGISIFHLLFRRVYIDSYAIEAIYVGTLLFITALFRRFFIAIYFEAITLSWHDLAVFSAQSLSTVLSAFIVFILLDLVFHRSHALWRRT